MQSHALKVLCLFAATFPAHAQQKPTPVDRAVMKIVRVAPLNRLGSGGFEAKANSNWRAFEKGFEIAAGEGRNGSAALRLENAAVAEARGAMQVVTLNQKAPQPIVIGGWSRAENVSGSADGGYALYADITYRDGDQLWGQVATFETGTHDWQYAEIALAPLKPIREINLYALLRGHSGRVWFDDIALSQPNDGGAMVFDGIAVQPVAPKKSVPKQLKRHATRDGLALALRPNDGGVASLQIDGREIAASAPSGFMARDVRSKSDYYPFQNGRCGALGLQLTTRWEDNADHIAVSGRLQSTLKGDRAISLVFALPIDARGWRWGAHLRSEPNIEDGGEYATTAAMGAGSNGQMSTYPYASAHNTRSGLAIGIDMNFAAQYRLAVNSATKQMFIAYDFGLVPEQKGTAEFRFVIYKTDAKWGFRDAVRRYQAIFPADYRVRDRTHGIWMPFTDVAKIERPTDFGIRYHEGDNNVAWDDAHDVLSFHYTEPGTWWMPMPPAMPRTYENAVAEMERIATDEKNPNRTLAQAVQVSGYRDANGRFRLLFKNEPWANGAVWSLNPNPLLPGPSERQAKWSEAIRKSLYDPKNGDLDGEYLDSLEGYVTADLDYSHQHFRFAVAPLSFDREGRPAIAKPLAMGEWTRWLSDQIHAAGKLMMANSVPNRWAFVTPGLDVMGTETNWLDSNGQYRPEDDATMNYRRALCGGKPYLFLQNTDFERFNYSLVERFFRRCLFYGVFPGFFSPNAADSPYWENPKWYNRDRDLFKRFIPLIRQVSQAGWQPLTAAKSSNAQIWLERFGANILTARNDGNTPQSTLLRLEAPLPQNGTATDALSGRVFTIKNGALPIEVPADGTLMLRLNN